LRESLIISRNPGFDRIQIFQKDFGRFRIAPEIGSFCLFLEFSYLNTFPIDVKDTSPTFPYADAEPLSDQMQSFARHFKYYVQKYSKKSVP